MKTKSLRIESLSSKDLEAVALLQPEGWPDIFPSVRYYCTSDFCFPLKAILDGLVVGIGTAIIHGSTAWLAHIIVHKDYRNGGIGTAITKALIDLIHKTPCRTILLTATALGEPVYKKVGFGVQTQYIFFDQGALPPPSDSVEEIVAFHKQYEKALLNLDLSVSGEDRRKLLNDYMSSATLFIENNHLKGFYIPTLGEGLIVAETRDVGLELMKIKSSTNKAFCLPCDNEHGIEFLANSGYQENRKASRMILGDPMTWDGSKIYSRIGGNLG